MVLYAVTVKYLPTDIYPSEEIYEKYMRFMKRKGMTLLDYKYELDSKGRLHLHGVGQSRPNFYRKSLDKKNYHHHVDLLDTEDDLKSWIKYYNMDYSNEFEYEQMLDAYQIQKILGYDAFIL